MATWYEILYKPTFVRRFKKLVPPLQSEVMRVIRDLADPKNHEQLRVHKLSGPLRQCHSCSINYSHRLVFVIDNKRGEIIVVDVGDHDVYR